MIRRRGRLARTWLMLANAVPTIADGARGALALSLGAAIPDDASVLEMGCGTGQLSLFLAGAGRLVVGADLTRAALELAQGAANQFGVGGVRFVETDVRAPGLRKEGFDV